MIITTVERKFFNKITKQFVSDGFITPEISQQYVVNSHGKVLIIKRMKLFTSNVEVEIAEHIIAVPFTGAYDKNLSPLYLHDIANCKLSFDIRLSSLSDIGLKREKDLYMLCKVIIMPNSEKAGIKYLFEVISKHPTFEKGFTWWLDSYDNFEIIGSSLTNPELLEQK